ncbi:MAG: tautomerase family protein [Bacteroidota bacterium]|nr:4-oxalocrotonate tautomerase [Christiangramia sp.]MEE2770896.1 tautomerase family protein [Bacteroidota bacterium]|tara:strand:- start:356 stop:580 length:225 start_codon:yes stop_codon:yes gene_type:complete
MPHFEIKLLARKTEEQKQELASELVKTAQRCLGYGEESFSVSIRDYSLEEWKNEIYPGILETKETLFKKPGYKM